MALPNCLGDVSSETWTQQTYFAFSFKKSVKFLKEKSTSWWKKTSLQPVPHLTRNWFCECSEKGWKPIAPCVLKRLQVLWIDLPARIWAKQASIALTKDMPNATIKECWLLRKENCNKLPRKSRALRKKQFRIHLPFFAWNWQPATLRISPGYGGWLVLQWPAALH